MTLKCQRAFNDETCTQQSVSVHHLSVIGSDLWWYRLGNQKVKLIKTGLHLLKERGNSVLFISCHIFANSDTDIINNRCSFLFKNVQKNRFGKIHISVFETKKYVM